jgi:hypothetical protein
VTRHESTTTTTIRELEGDSRGEEPSSTNWWSSLLTKWQSQLAVQEHDRTWKSMLGD